MNDQSPQPEYQRPGLCPHCGSGKLYNSWGRGNSLCADCGREYNVVFRDGFPYGEKLPSHNQPSNN